MLSLLLMKSDGSNSLVPHYYRIFQHRSSRSFTVMYRENAEILAFPWFYWHLKCALVKSWYKESSKLEKKSVCLQMYEKLFSCTPLTNLLPYKDWWKRIIGSYTRVSKLSEVKPFASKRIPSLFSPISHFFNIRLFVARHHVFLITAFRSIAHYCVSFFVGSLPVIPL